MKAQKPREIAARALETSEREKIYLENILEESLSKAPISGVDRAFTQELAYGVVRWERALDWLIGLKATRTPPRSMPRILLRLGLYQLFWLDRVPDHAAVNETVELAKRVGWTSQAGFINAVLRGFLRERDETARKLEALRETDPAIAFSHPDWLCERWRQRWGEIPMRQMLAWNNSVPPTYVRVNALRADAELLTAQWKREGVEVEPWSSDWVQPGSVFILKSHPPLTELTSFQHGWFYVQDPSTLLSVHMLDAQPGETVLDLCAAPGGKATAIAQRMRNEGRLWANDLNEQRCDLIRRNAERMGTTCLRVVASGDRPWVNKPLDRILIDAPCSNTGVIRRRIEVRFRLKPDELSKLAAMQLGFLEQSAPWLTKGGTLVYSTCSLEAEENRDAVDQFLKIHPEFRLVQDRTLIPFRDGVDGAYVALLRKE